VSGTASITEVTGALGLRLPRGKALNSPVMDVPELMTVGQLARRAGLTAKALRHYDRIGLLTPAVVDPATGYRRYRPEQVRLARLVRLLRSVDVPLEQVRACLVAPDDEDALRRLLAVHRRRLQARLDRLRADVHRIDHLIEDGVTTMIDEEKSTAAPVADERKLAVELFNGVWRLMESEDRTVEEDDRMLHMAHASRYHWGQVGTAENLSRGEWQCSRVYAVLGRAEPALHHARRDLEICRANGLGDWDLAFAYEALARASAVAGDKEQARSWTEQALAAAEDIAEDDDRELLMSDLESLPGQSRFW
jgi:DNA-binding transcriptional MerR regulator